MTAYILKTVLCASLFLGFYLLILQREKILRFNRFYLLFSLLLSFCIPFLPLQFGTAYLPDTSTAAFVIPEVETEVIYTRGNDLKDSNTFFHPALTCYIVITAFLLLRFCKNILSIY